MITNFHKEHKAKFLALIVAMVVVAPGFALEHTVKRGETVESVASRYGMTAEQFMAVVPNAENMFFTGMKLQIPENAIKDPIIENPLFDSYIAQAKQEFNDANYKESAKLYGKALELEQSAKIYYNRGLAYYKCEKYGNAIDDFEKCLSLGASTDEMRHVHKLLAQAKEIETQKKQQRLQSVGALIGMVAVGAAAYMQAKQQNEAAKANGRRQQYGTSTVSPQGTSDYSGSEDDTSTSTSNTVSNSRKKCMKLSASDNAHCNGSGVCSRCNGDGKYYDTSFGLSKWVDCKTCGGSGECPSCDGTGYR